MYLPNNGYTDNTGQDMITGQNQEHDIGHEYKIKDMNTNKTQNKRW